MCFYTPWMESACNTYLSIMSVNRAVMGASKNKTNSAAGATSRKDATNVTSCAGLIPTAEPKHKSPAPSTASPPTFLAAKPD